MKRRDFLKMLGIAPAIPLVGKGMTTEDMDDDLACMEAVAEQGDEPLMEIPKVLIDPDTHDGVSNLVEWSESGMRLSEEEKQRFIDYFSVKENNS